MYDPSSFSGCMPESEIQRLRKYTFPIQIMINLYPGNLCQRTSDEGPNYDKYHVSHLQMSCKRKIRWFSTNNSKVYYSLALCHEHGPVAGKDPHPQNRRRKIFRSKNPESTEDTEAADEIREKHESLRRKKLLRRSLEKQV